MNRLYRLNSKTYKLITEIILIFLLGLTILSCSTPGVENVAAKNCNSLFLVGHVFAGEERIITVNDEEVYRYRFDNSQKVYTIRDKICAEFQNCMKVNLVSYHSSKKYIDTTFIFTPDAEEEYYEIAVSLPHPLKLDGYIKNGKIVKEWGYLPINLSQRMIGLYPASHSTTLYR